MRKQVSNQVSPPSLHSHMPSASCQPLTILLPAPSHISIAAIAIHLLKPVHAHCLRLIFRSNLKNINYLPSADRISLKYLYASPYGFISLTSSSLSIISNSCSPSLDSGRKNTNICVSIKAVHKNNIFSHGNSWASASLRQLKPHCKRYLPAITHSA